ncbi:MAG: NifB/NifX family molybdenum-iron cluster-binding protein [Proteobacteria bacterium]|nr:NifB/NifX family molybdenum-iron cluster-binding protein [Pseudomonadota bacterium]
MKLCITSSGKDMDSKVDERFGRAPYFLIIDTDTIEFKTVKNSALLLGRGAGVSAAQIISDNGAEALLTGIVGPNAFAALRSAKIKIYEGVSGGDTVKDALDNFKKGGYTEASAPSRGPGRGGRFRGNR